MAHVPLQMLHPDFGMPCLLMSDQHHPSIVLNVVLKHIFLGVIFINLLNNVLAVENYYYTIYVHVFLIN